jgi:hypothetical protein
MKLNTLAILAISTLFATSIATASNSNMTLADDVSAMSGTASMGGSNTMSGNVGNPNPENQMQSQNNTNSPTDTSNSNDDMSADTATGDDDY